MALNRKTFPKVTAAAAAENTFASENFNTVLYTGTGATQRIGGYINRGAVFNGSSSYIASVADIGFNDSVSMWFNVEPSGTGTYSLFGRENGGGLEWGGVSLYYDGTDYNLNIQIRSDAGNYLYQAYQNFTLSAGWHHLVFTFDSSSGYTAYIDDSEVTLTTTLSSGTITFPSGTSSIGRVFGNNDPATYFRGKIDQVRIFNKKLSSSEVTTLNGETHASTTKSTTDIFGDGSGVALYQLDGNANDTGGVSGKYGSAAHFNGSSSYIAIDDSTDLRLAGTDYSISFWFNANNVSHSGRLINKDDATDFSGGYTVMLNTNATLTIGHNDGSNNQNWNPSNTFSANTWYHIVVTYSDSSNLRTLYIDGSSAATIATNTNIAASSDKLFFGTYGASSPSGQYFNGKIDDVRIYSDALTAAEVGYIYNNTTASIPTDNLEAHYKFDGDARDEQQLHDGVATNVTYAYDGTASNITYQEATKFSPDLMWIKKRTAGANSNFQSNAIFDSVRGLDRIIYTNLTSAEYNGGGAGAGYMNSVDSNGFTLTGNAIVNESSQSFVAWCWNAGTDAAASNTDGVTAGSVTAVTSTVKANTAAGFSICTFTTPSSGKPSWGHGLDSAPELIIVKNTGGSGHWQLYAPSLLGQKELRFTTAAATAYSPDFISVDTSKIDLGSTSFNISGSSAHVAYCFHSVDGYSKIGTYTGNGSASGTIVETGFEPAFVIIKGTDQTSDWIILDNKRDNINPNSARLDANSSGAEYTGEDIMDFLSNGFQLKTSSASKNGSGNEFIYLAIAADPDETTPTVEDSFDVVTYTGTGSSQDIQTNFKPDLVWIKNRDTTSVATIHNSINGAGYYSIPSTTNALSTLQTDVFSSFNSNGFTVGTSSATNGSGNNIVAWCWKAGDHDDNLPEINTNGTIDSVVSVNDAAGFSIVKYTGNGTNGATVGHGLSSAPELIILKNTSSGGASDHWLVGNTPTGWTQAMHLNLTNASGTSNLYWNDTAPTSSVFTLGHYTGIYNANNDEHIAYCWYSVSGHSKIGSYTGTGASQSISVGFQPRFVIIKRTNSTGNWEIYDSQRGEHIVIQSDNSNAEYDYSTTGVTDFNTNSFTVAGTAGNHNASGSTYIYMAFK